MLQTPGAEPDGTPLPSPIPIPVPGRRARRAALPSIGVLDVPPPSVGRSPVTPSDDGTSVDADGPTATRNHAAPADDLGRELALLQRLDHDHLVRVHRVIGTNQGPGLLMELAAGGSLLELVTSRGPLPIAEVVTTLVPVAQALDHLHASGALHGDVTPGNILFTHQGRPLLADLGTGRLLGTDPLLMPGTPGFLDPGRTGSYDSGADVFALAAVAWFALTGRIPGPTDQRPPLALIVPAVPITLMQLIEDALSTSRERRPTAGSFARTLLSASAAEPVDLVPAVHASVLPDLLTRRADQRPAPPRSLITRLRRTGASSGPRSPGTGSTGADRSVNAPSRPTRSGRPTRPARSFPGSAVTPTPDEESPRRRGTAHGSLPSQEGPRRRSTTFEPVKGDDGAQYRIRRVLGVVSGCVAAVLLVVGVMLTVEGLRGPDSLVSEPAVQGDGTGTGAPIADGQAVDGTPEPSVSEREVTSEDGTSDASPEQLAGSEDPSVALSGLVALRASAFATADPDVLRTVDVDGSPAMVADQEAVAVLTRSGSTLRGLSIGLRDQERLTGDDVAADSALATVPGVAAPPDGLEVAFVRATAQISPYTEEPAVNPAAKQAAEGTSEEDADAEPPSLMAAGQQELIFVLWDTADGWRIHSVVEPPED